jgi:hypothetical protein
MKDLCVHSCYLGAGETCPHATGKDFSLAGLVHTGFTPVGGTLIEMTRAAGARTGYLIRLARSNQTVPPALL